MNQPVKITDEQIRALLLRLANGEAVTIEDGSIAYKAIQKATFDALPPISDLLADLRDWNPLDPFWADTCRVCRKSPIFLCVCSKVSHKPAGTP